jgi:SpoVK/Ycf46/Vps4 family AAA+-type ATPase
MEHFEQRIQQEALLAALRYYNPDVMELALDQAEQAEYTHKFFVKVKDSGLIVYRMETGYYAVSEEVISHTTPTPPPLSHNESEAAPALPGEDLSPTQRALQYRSQPPLYTFEQLVVPAELMDDLQAAVAVLRLEQLVFDQWGLRAIEPFPHTALNFHGPPGTGKTLAAHAIAYSLQRPILVASYAEIESKFHGEGPKNIKAVFSAAERDQAVLFIDEADSLLSKRLTEVTHGAEQAINSMRSQLFLCLQEYQGIVIFATNLVENYDRAFETRVRHFAFPLPDHTGRTAIWRKHLVPQLPLASDVEPTELAQHAEDVCGRDIKNAVIDAAIRTARSGRTQVTAYDLTTAIDRLRAARIITDKQHEKA